MSASVLALTAGIGLALPGGAAPSPAPLPDLFTFAPRASAAPVAAPSGLPEIGRVRASVCRSIVNWSAAAAQNATKNDVTLNGLVETLPELQLDDYVKPKQERTLQQLRNTASEVRISARDGLGATSRIRAYAQTMNDLVQRSALLAYVDAMDDALRNQQTAAEDMQRAMVIAEGRRAVFEAKLQMAKGEKMGSTVVIDEPGSYKYMLTAIAQRIDERQTDVRRAERTVADKAKGIRC